MGQERARPVPVGRSRCPSTMPRSGRRPSGGRPAGRGAAHHGTAWRSRVGTITRSSATNRSGPTSAASRSAIVWRCWARTVATRGWPAGTADSLRSENRAWSISATTTSRGARRTSCVRRRVSDHGRQLSVEVDVLDERSVAETAAQLGEIESPTDGTRVARCHPGHRRDPPLQADDLGEHRLAVDLLRDRRRVAGWPAGAARRGRGRSPARRSTRVVLATRAPARHRSAATRTSRARPVSIAMRSPSSASSTPSIDARARRSLAPSVARWRSTTRRPGIDRPTGSAALLVEQPEQRRRVPRRRATRTAATRWTAGGTDERLASHVDLACGERQRSEPDEHLRRLRLPAERAQRRSAVPRASGSREPDRPAPRRSRRRTRPAPSRAFGRSPGTARRHEPPTRRPHGARTSSPAPSPVTARRRPAGARCRSRDRRRRPEQRSPAPPPGSRRRSGARHSSTSSSALIRPAAPNPE